MDISYKIITIKLKLNVIQLQHNDLNHVTN